MSAFFHPRGPWVALVVLLCSPVQGARAEGACGAVELGAVAEQAFYDGTSLLAQGRPAEALKAFDRALEAAPGFYRAHLYRSRAQVLLSDAEGAATAIEAFAACATSSAEQQEEAELRARLADLVDRLEANAPVAPAQGRGPTFHVGLLGGYSAARGDQLYHRGLARLDLELGFGAGFGARVGVGVAAARTDGVTYGVVPVSMGLRWRPQLHIRPYADLHMLLLFHRDGAIADADPVEGASKAPSVGVGGGGGVEFPLFEGNGARIGIGPDVQVGYAGMLVLQAGVSLRVTLGEGGG